MKYSAVLFDADGTLFDYAAAMREALKGAFAAFGLPFPPGVAELYDGINEAYWRMHERGEIEKEDFQARRFCDLFEKLGLRADGEAFNRAFLAGLADCSAPIPGAREACEALHKAGVRLAVITNGVTETQRRRVARSPMAPLFEEIFISDEIGKAKPDPAFFDVVFEKMRITARESALVVGDSLQADIAGGIAAGADTCWFNPEKKENTTKFQPRYEIAELKEVLPIVI